MLTLLKKSTITFIVILSYCAVSAAMEPFVTASSDATSSMLAALTQKKMEEADVCGICREVEDLHPLPCHPKHLFHTKCIETAKKYSPNCPLCNVPIPLSLSEKLLRNKCLIGVVAYSFAFSIFWLSMVVQYNNASDSGMCSANFSASSYNLAVFGTCPANY